MFSAMVLTAAIMAGCEKDECKECQNVLRLKHAVEDLVCSQHKHRILHGTCGCKCKSCKCKPVAGGVKIHCPCQGVVGRDKGMLFIRTGNGLEFKHRLDLKKPRGEFLLRVNWNTQGRRRGAVVHVEVLD